MPTLAPLSPDIVVVNPNGEYLILVEVKLNTITKEAEERLKKLMVSMGCSIGLLISTTQIILFRDSLRELNGQSIQTIESAQLPPNFFHVENKSDTKQWHDELEAKIQQWLEKIQSSVNIDNFSPELQKILEYISPLLQIVEVRAAHLRYLK